MAEQNVTNGTAGFKEAVCIDAGRVYDSCSEIQYSLFTKVEEVDGDGEGSGGGNFMGGGSAVIGNVGND